MAQWLSIRIRPRRHMWVEFVVGSRLCTERFFSGYSGFPPSAKTNISKFKFDLERTVTFERVPRELFGASWINKLPLHFFPLCSRFCNSFCVSWRETPDGPLPHNFGSGCADLPGSGSRERALALKHAFLSFPYN